MEQDYIETAPKQYKHKARQIKIIDGTERERDMSKQQLRDTIRLHRKNIKRSKADIKKYKLLIKQAKLAYKISK